MNLLEELTYSFTIYAFLIILIVGFVGNSLNLITLATKKFRTQAPIFYLMWSTVWSQVFIVVGITLRFATEYFGNDLINSNRMICKVRNYLLVCLPFMSVICTFLAAFDRCVATSLNVRLRQLSSISVARLVTPTSVFLVAISSFFLNFVFDIHNGKCVAVGRVGIPILHVYVISFVILIPVCGMLICGIMTWIHYKTSRSRVETISNTVIVSQQQRRINRQVIVLTSIQCFMTMIAYIIRAVTYTYVIVSESTPKSILRVQIEYLVLQVSIMLLYVNHSIAFYLNLIISQTFKKTFILSVRLVIGKLETIFCKNDK